MAQPRMQVSEHAAEDSASRVVGDQVANRRLDLVKPPLEIAQRVELNAVNGYCRRRLSMLAGRPRGAGGMPPASDHPGG